MKSTSVSLWVLKYFLFIGYILICLSINRFHPFARYTMFNKFPDVVYIFSLRDNNNKLIPLDAYTQVSSNHLYELYVAINEQHKFAHEDESEKPAEQRIVYEEMMNIVFKDLKKPLPTDSVSLNRVSFYTENGKLLSNEKQLYKCKVE